MNLADAMEEWSTIRSETEAKLRRAQGSDPWPERAVAMERRLNAIAIAQDLLRSPSGPIPLRHVDQLVSERNRLRALVQEVADHLGGFATHAQQLLKEET